MENDGTPKGITLAASTGNLTAKPASSGTFTLAITVTDVTAARPSTGEDTLKLTVSRN